MPTPSFFERYAPIAHTYRWHLGGTAGAALFVILSFIATVENISPRFHGAMVIVGTVLAPFVVWAWGLMLVGVWFHPTRGNLRFGSPWLFNAPRPVQAAARWYGAFALTLFLAFPAVVALWLLWVSLE